MRYVNVNAIHIIKKKKNKMQIKKNFFLDVIQVFV